MVKAVGYLNENGETVVNREYLKLMASLEWHLKYNHYPPLPTKLIGVCIQAIDKGVEAEIFDNWDLLDEEIKLPEGLRGKTTKISDLIEGCHLHDYIAAKVDESRVIEEDVEEVEK